MKRKLISMVLCLFLVTGLFSNTALASVSWPDDVSIDSDAGIVMDAHSGAVLYGKNIHSTYSPASITKVLTALIILENCQLDDMVTFSQNAVYNVEANSTSAGYDTGDQATVKDCLYALLLKSANESANALAEHLSGSTEAFCILMNERAAELGCQDSYFSNPSGLNDENQRVSAYDMALITQAAFDNEVFSEIVSTTYYTLPPNKKNPEGQGISPGNKMVKPNWPDQYRADVIGGKTGYTSIALNTLVICAEQNDTKLVSVVLHSPATQYEDTKKLLDFGFRNFRSVKIAEYDKTYSSISDDLKISGLPTSDKPALTVDPESYITLPETADFSEATAMLDYTLPPNAPPGSVARINYTLGERSVGYAYLTLGNSESVKSMALPEALLEIKPTSLASSGAAVNPEDDGANSAEQSTVPEPDSSQGPLKISLKIPSLFWKLLIGIFSVAVIGGGIFLYSNRKRQKEAEELLRRRKRRAERLRETGMSESDFELLLQKRRTDTNLNRPDKSPDMKRTKK